MSARPFIRHVVFFSARDKKDVPTIVEGLSLLGNIPHSQNFGVSQNRRKDALSDDVDVIVYAEFDSEEALAAYKAHPIYQESIDIVRPLRELRIAADF
ncbi:Dabb family protein [Aliiruegeria sabulilitoris]|uniref:Dabb family protein n=1 Tax=Aliiruegeria sabulilitoris TaxID=1510458 RepID=UPI0008302552|nr:Dabb family protein [Aliiruegeria sabulilitoris]NDR59624.1 Dabb family protein [Pseudoruegeria sp. M32A2M]